MAVLLLKRQVSKAHTADLLSSDTAEIPGTLVISGSTLAGTEVLRVVGETRIEGTLHGALNGSGLIVGVAGASSGTGSTIQVGSFTTTQQGFLTPAAGMEIYNTTQGWFQSNNGSRWGDDARNNNFQATSSPTTSNDNTQGYTIGSIWINTTTNRTYICNSAITSTANWQILPITTQATVNFGFSGNGDEDTTASATISASWVATTTQFQCTAMTNSSLQTVGGTPDHPTTDEDAAVEQITAYVTNVIANTSLEVIASAPNGTWGQYYINVLAS
jgi:hypothetical protein